ncbi:uncharacterized protein LOC120215470 [Hibiscus syriacus]|uniref:uncharacterized protein LOC120215470 n=1 Tax=Hibiscus syriacus TaxID=106335 RepID=UPI0019233AD5|nr:uncharacterized protein LOC120215470 [Hibiscus syriacus]
MVRMLYNEQGQQLVSFDDTSGEVVHFFQSLVGAVDPDMESCNVSTLSEIVGFKISSDVGRLLTGEVYNIEIKEVFFTMVMIKHRDWMNILPSSLKWLRSTSNLLLAFNATTLVLVPKVVNACNMKDFRPLSCCSVVYRAITRIMVRRLAIVFLDMVRPNQSAFVKGQDIVDNTLLAQENVRGQLILPRSVLKKVDQLCMRSFFGGVQVLLLLVLIWVSWGLNKVFSLKEIVWPLFHAGCSMSVRMRHAIVSWLTLLNRLATKDIIRRMSMVLEGICVLCWEEEETRSHLFFSFPFWARVWRAVLSWSDV